MRVRRRPPITSRKRPKLSCGSSQLKTPLKPRFCRGPIVHRRSIRALSRTSKYKRKQQDCPGESGSGRIVGNIEPTPATPVLRLSSPPPPCENRDSTPNRHEPNRIRNARRRRTHYYSRNLARPRHYARRISAHSEIDGPDANAHRAGHLQRNVERALLLQVVARAPEAAAHAQQARPPGARRERRHHRHRRRMGLRVQNRVTQPSIVHRAIPGGDDWRGRHPSRHLHHGSPPGSGDGFAALWASHSSARTRQSHAAQEPLRDGRCSERRGLLRQLFRSAQRRRRGEVRELLQRQPPGKRVRSRPGQA